MATFPSVTKMSYSPAIALGTTLLSRVEHSSINRSIYRLIAYPNRIVFEFTVERRFVPATNEIQGTIFSRGQIIRAWIVTYADKIFSVVYGSWLERDLAGIRLRCALTREKWSTCFYRAIRQRLKSCAK